MDRRVSFKSNGRAHTYFQDEIFYMESDNHKVAVCMKQQRPEYYGKIGEFEKKLKPDFFRIHKGYLINLKYVDHYDRTDVYMENGDMLRISKYKYQAFVEAYTAYLHGKSCEKRNCG